MTRLEEMLANHSLTKHFYVEYIENSQNSAKKGNNNYQVRKLEIALDSHYTNKEIWMAPTCVKRCSTSTVIKKTQIKITVKYYRTPPRMA